MGSLPADRYWQGYRIGSAIAVVAIHVVVAYGLGFGLNVAVPRHVEGDRPLLTVFDPLPPPPSEPPPSPKVPELAVKSAGPTPREALPLPKVVPVPTPPIIAIPSLATDAVPAGSGAGATGGTAGGSDGAGSGGGEGIGNGEDFSPARQTRGRFRNSDFPASVRGTGRLRIGVRYAVGPTGRVDRCEIIDPSGYAEVDAMTCRVIVERYRFRPARDAQGIPITEVMEEDYTWTMD